MDNKTVYVVERVFPGKSEVESVFLKRESALQHAEEMEKVSLASYYVNEFVVKDAPEDI